MFLEKKKRRIWPYIVLVFFLVVTVAAASGYQYVKRLTPEKVLQNPFVRHYAPAGLEDLLQLSPSLLGYNGSKTYLVLFENNTELRPGGGFIGVYAVVKMENGHPTILAVEGTELLDRRAPSPVAVAPPQPITEYLKVDRWYFRDSNWSPDFATSAQQALTLYRAEGGVSADQIDAVVAFTPTVLEELLKITGPFTIDGLTFNADQVTETLEYEVEYGYKGRGIGISDRKDIIKPFMEQLLEHVKGSLLTHYQNYLALAQRMGEEKQILAYAPDEKLQTAFANVGIAGSIAQTSGDYLLWADANLAALKTDHAMQRNLSYRIEKSPEGAYLATASMTYHNTGVFDWRTSRYRTYVRVFVPKGSVLIGTEGSMKTDRSTAPDTTDQGEELGKQWFGTFISIEPGATKTLTFRYQLPDAIGKQVEAKAYTLVVQKELGTIAHGLTLDLNFGTTIQAATPPEAKEKWGDARYEMTSDLRVDRAFTVNF